jgi:1-phosphofructokinase family hexose kinase
MVLTVTLNPAIDKLLIMNQFVVHKLHRLESNEKSIISAGGKGVNIAMNLQILKDDVVASGFASGHSGHLLCDELRRKGITTSFIFTEGLTRTNISILDQENETLTEINDYGHSVTEADQAFFLENYDRLLHRVDTVVLAGSLPLGVSEEIYRKMIQLARRKKLKVIMHTSPYHMDPIMDSSPHIIIPDMRSFHEMLGKPCDGIDQFIQVGKEVLVKNKDSELVIFIHRIENVVAVSRSASFIIKPENLKIVNMLGYADAWLAGFIHQMLKNTSLRDTLNFASAAGLTNVESLHKEIMTVESIKKNLKRIIIEELS